MKNFLQLSLFLALCCGVCDHLFGQQKERKALFIGIDGVRSDALQQANTPNMDALMANGIFTFDSWHLGVTSSGPSWSSMLTGVWEAKHRVTNNSYSGANYGEFPYIPTRMKEVKPDLKCVQIITWNPQDDAANGTGGNVFNSGWDKSIDAGNLGQGLVTAAAKIQLLDPELDFLFIHYDETDAAGHANGFSPDVLPYMNAIEQADREIGEVIAALKARPTFDQEDWIILSTTDHGGLGFGHGGNSNTERAIWWYCSGDHVPNVEITGADPGSYQMPSNPVDTATLAETPVLTDIAVTILDWMLPDTNPEEVETWGLDGKSWTRKLENTVATHQRFRTDINAFSITPNPAKGMALLKISNPTESIALKIINLNGQIMQALELRGLGRQEIQHTLDFTNLQAGTYAIELTDGYYVNTKMIVVE